VSATSRAIYLHVNRKPDAPRYVHMEVPFSRIKHVAFGTTKVLGGARTTMQIFPNVQVESLRYSSTPKAEHRVLMGIFFPFRDNRSHLLVLHQDDAPAFRPTLSDLLSGAGVSTVG
jgi:hypothetical protein